MSDLFRSVMGGHSDGLVGSIVEAGSHRLNIHKKVAEFWCSNLIISQDIILFVILFVDYWYYFEHDNREVLQLYTEL